MVHIYIHVLSIPFTRLSLDTHLWPRSGSAFMARSGLWKSRSIAGEWCLGGRKLRLGDMAIGDPKFEKRHYHLGNNQMVC